MKSMIISQEIFHSICFCSSKGVDLEKHIMVNILEISVAIVSNIGETGVNVIYLANCQIEANATRGITLFRHEVKLHN